MSKALTPRQAGPAARSMSPRPKKIDGEKVSMSVRIEPEILSILQKLSAETEHTIGHLIRRYLVKGLESEGLIKKSTKKD